MPCRGKPSPAGFKDVAALSPAAGVDLTSTPFFAVLERYGAPKIPAGKSFSTERMCEPTLPAGVARARQLPSNEDDEALAAEVRAFLPKLKEWKGPPTMGTAWFQCADKTCVGVYTWIAFESAKPLAVVRVQTPRDKNGALTEDKEASERLAVLAAAEAAKFP